MSRKTVVLENAHIFPHTRGGTQNEVNIRRADHTTHRAYDRLYGLLTPLESLEVHLGIIGKTLKREVRHQIQEAIRDNKDKGDGYVYTEGVRRAQ